VAVLGDQHEAHARTGEDARGAADHAFDAGFDRDSLAIRWTQVGQAAHERLAVDVGVRFARGGSVPDDAPAARMFGPWAGAGTTARGGRPMRADPHDDDEERDADAGSEDDGVDEASEESFPASDPPSFGSFEPG
jgi:hypothetical protein